MEHYHNPNPDQPGEFYCVVCNKTFASSSALRRHFKGVHEGLKQKGPRDFRCKLCKEVFTNKYKKEKHWTQVHNDGKTPLRKCFKCNLEFQLFTDFKIHVDSQHVDCHICMVCGMDFSEASLLITHTEEHKHIDIKSRRFECDLCGHRLFNKIQLTVHMRKHQKEVNFYVCDICGKSYKFIAVSFSQFNTYFNSIINVLVFTAIPLS